MQAKSCLCQLSLELHYSEKYVFMMVFMSKLLSAQFSDIMHI